MSSAPRRSGPASPDSPPNAPKVSTARLSRRGGTKRCAGSRCRVGAACGQSALPVANHRIRFAAEDRHAVMRRQAQQRLDAVPVRFAGGDPIVVRRSSRRPDGWLARPSTELVTREPVADSRLLNELLQRLTVELRIVSAVRAAAAVNQHLDTIPLEPAPRNTSAGRLLWPIV